MISALFFDASGTIIIPHPSVGAQYAAAATEFGLNADPDELDAGFRLAFRNARLALGLETLPYGRTHSEARAFWRPVIVQAFAHAGHAMPDGPAERTYFDTLYERFATRECWRLDDDFAGAIALARQCDVRVGLLSNFDPRLRPLLADLAIAHHFDPIIISCELGAEKPSPVLFEAARAACGGIPPDQIALIGDTPEEDIAGALNAGWRACLIDRTDRHPQHKGLRACDLMEAVRCVLA